MIFIDTVADVGAVSGSRLKKKGKNGKERFSLSLMTIFPDGWFF